MRISPFWGWFSKHIYGIFNPMLKRLTVVVAILLLALPASAFAAGLTQNESSLLRQMNLVRSQHGLGRLSFDAHLQRAARAHSRDMLRSNTFAHGAFGTRMFHFQIAGSFAGENLAWGTGAEGTAAGVVAAWLASPEHRANLLRPRFTRVGIGTFTGTFLGHQGANVINADFAG